MRDPERVAFVQNQGRGASRGYSPSAFADIVRARARVFETSAFFDGQGTFYAVGDESHFGMVARVSPEFFEVTGITPKLGRSFGPADFMAGAAPVALVSFDVWRRSLGSQPNALGKSIDVGGRLYSIIGVMPPDESSRFFASVVLPATARSELTWPTVVGRLRAGVSRDAAQEELRRAVDPILTEVFGVGQRPFRTLLIPVTGVPGPMTDLHKMLFLAAALVLIIACANLASLMLARGLARGREYALRFALGAQRSSVIRQTLLEALACAILAAALGILFALWIFDLLTRGLTSDVPQLGIVAVSLNWRVFAFAAVAACCAALLFGVYPALRASSVRLAQPLKDGAGTTTRRSHGRYSKLVIAQVALTLALLMGSSLLIQSAREMRDRDVGFDPAGLLSLNVYVPRVVRDSLDGRALQRSLLDAIAREPGVSRVATHGHAGARGDAIFVTLPSGGNRRSYFTSYAVVSPSYLATLGIQIEEGRDFVSGDAQQPVGAAIVSRTAARALWRGENPIGQMIRLADAHGPGSSVRVVGIAPDVGSLVVETPDAEPAPAVYVVTNDSTPRFDQVIVRGSATDQRALQTRLHRRLHDLLPPRVSAYVRPFLAELDAQVAIRYFMGGTFIALALLALGLALFGVYSVRSHNVALRRREYAVRIALGSTERDVARTVLRESLVIVLAGTGFGAFVAMYVARRLDPWLFGVFYTDVRALVLGELVLIATALLASLIPALRAARSNPVETLRAN